jgi:hypothetical protein
MAATRSLRGIRLHGVRDGQPLAYPLNPAEQHRPRCGRDCRETGDTSRFAPVPDGKKEARELAAKTAGVGTEWEELFKRHEALTGSDVEYQ